MKKRKKYIYTILFLVVTIVSTCVGVKIVKNEKKDEGIKTTVEIAYKEPGYSFNNVKIVWDGLTEDELAAKLDKNLYHELAGTGKYFAKYTAETGLDPYLAVSIVNLETGCKWGCSYLARVCNNIGGMKGKPSCNGGSYARFDSLEDGINSYLNMLYKYYWLKGLTTPEKMNSKYAESTTWASKVNAYYKTVKAS